MAFLYIVLQQGLINKIVLAEKDWAGGKNCLYKALSPYVQVNIAVFLNRNCNYFYLSSNVVKMMIGWRKDRRRLESCQ